MHNFERYVPKQIVYLGDFDWLLKEKQCSKQIFGFNRYYCHQWKCPLRKYELPANGRLEVSAEVNTDVEVERAWRHGVTVVTPRNGHQLCRLPPAPAKRPRTHVWEDIFQFSHHPFPTLSQFQCIYHTHCWLSHSKFNNAEDWEEM